MTAAFWSRSPATPPRSTTRCCAFDRRHRHDLPGAGRRAPAHHAVPGPVRSRAAQPHLAQASRRSAPARPNGWTVNFPVEIEPLARETNALIDANREIVERARTHVGNLAHALKTPLSVMMNEAAARGDDPLADKVKRADRHHARSGDAPSRARADRGARRRGRHHHRCACRWCRRSPAPWRRRIATSDIAIDLDMQRRGARFAASGRISRRWSAIWSTMPANGRGRASSIEVCCEQPEPGRQVRAHRGRRRRAGADAVAARAGVAARAAARRDQAGLGARAVDRGRACGALRRRAEPRHRADRRACGRSWCCRRGEGYFFATRASVSFASNLPQLLASARRAWASGCRCRLRRG